MSELHNETNSTLTEAEQKILEVMLNPENRMKSITDICNIAKISRQTYYRAFEKKEFNEAYNNGSRELIRQCVAPVINTFIREAQRGSFQHGKVILEMAGIYTEKQEITAHNTNINIDADYDQLKAKATPDELKRINDATISAVEVGEIMRR